MRNEIPLTFEINFPKLCGLESDCGSPTQTDAASEKVFHRAASGTVKRIRHALLRKCKKGKRRNYPLFCPTKLPLTINFYESKERISIREHLLVWDDILKRRQLNKISLDS